MAIPEPAASRRTLFFSAGLVWLIGGAILAWRAAHLFPPDHRLWPIYAGAALGVIKFMLVFRRIAVRNIRRIRELSPQKDKICVFAFQSWSSYLIVVIMIGLGITLRLVGTPITPLMLIYALIATALMLGSVVYFRAALSNSPIDEP